MTEKIKEEKRNEFNPDYVTSPGETLLDTINALGMTQTDLAARAGKHKKTINEFIKDKAPISPETAIHLETILGVPASFWNNRQARYNEFKARNEEYSNLKKNVDFLNKFPVKQMVKYGWLPKDKDKTGLLQKLLSYFGVASTEALDNYINTVCVPSYRVATEYDPYAMAAWLKQGEIITQSIKFERYDKSAFRAIFPELRILSLKEPNEFLPELQKECAAVGVAVVYVRELPGTRVCGAARWLKTGTPLIQLSLRYKKDDHFWFTFFHEVRHILQNKTTSIILDDKDNLSEPNDKDNEDFESDANRFASRTLIPSNVFDEINTLGIPSEESILEISTKFGIAPGILVGQLQHKGIIPWNSALNKLKKTVEFPD